MKQSSSSIAWLGPIPQFEPAMRDDRPPTCGLLGAAPVFCGYKVPLRYLSLSLIFDMLKFHHLSPLSIFSIQYEHSIGV